MKGIVKGEGNSIGVNKGIRGDVYSNNKVQMRYIVTTFSFPCPMLLMNISVSYHIVCTDYHTMPPPQYSFSNRNVTFNNTTLPPFGYKPNV